jgi:hypothetical protein
MAVRDHFANERHYTKPTANWYLNQFRTKKKQIPPTDFANPIFRLVVNGHLCFRAPAASLSENLLRLQRVSALALQLTAAFDWCHEIRRFAPGCIIEHQIVPILLTSFKRVCQFGFNRM